MIFEQALIFNKFECPLDHKEVEVISDSVYRFISGNFSIERLNELKSDRAKHSRTKSKANLIYVDGKPWEDEGIPKRTYYYRKNNPRSESENAQEPWKSLNMSRATYFRKKKAGLINVA